MKSALSLLAGCTMLPVACFAQDAPSSVPGSPGVTEGEHLGSSLIVADAEEGRAGTAAESAGEPVSLAETGDSNRRGRWRVAPHLSAKGTYDDNIFIQPGNKVADYEFRLSPGLALGFWDSVEARERYLERQRSAAILERSRGSFVVVDYTAILLGFARTPSLNALDHDGTLDVQWQSGKLTLGTRLHAESKSETSTDVGGRVRRRAVFAEITSSYQISEKTRLGFAVNHRTNNPEDFVRTAEWYGEGFLDYAVTPRMRFGFGLGAGRLQVEAGPDQTFQRVLGRADYLLSEKLEAEFRGGVEFRQSDGRAGDRTNPVFEVRGAWSPAPGTRFALEVSRRVESSVVQTDLDYTLTGVALEFRQAIRGGLHLLLAGGYHVADYTRSPLGDERTDRYFFVRPGLLYNFATWGNVGLTYEYRRNRSDRPSSEFANQQTSLEVGLAY